MELDFKAIGKRIKIARIRTNLTQESVADKIGVTPQHVSNIETGNSSVSLTTLVAIANLLNVSVDELLCDTVLKSKAVFIKEADDIFKDCNEYEVRVLVDVLKATKSSMRNIKLFESSMNKNE
ncbi:UNVERIFIED_CONTAM: XRE family transcriptional regulator [Clostridioides difficile]|uniref:helix-turn-helix domain-containing protein n=2 Tax=Clostridioides difficile TaxID=1496 RepID=UPI0005179375|nr:helix-turn-helix transcriptional regulator [Clostridioides difficile]MDC2931184.1 helix-turn-helix transcriptional regulator [Clostridioides difficile]MDE3610913.1 helix-turn-helix transcriptional regulator [Clostridioides difficile]MDM9792012.1 helix-turn-helix transcriptional regulator [Clostridioides difficile]MEC5401135.1 helix-turn-helix transcriptional regulator [Clostridioides difficile]TLE40779.1 helix-turn-helix transcriptional regulator [Clostridioides difficile]